MIDNIWVIEMVKKGEVVANAYVDELDNAPKGRELLKQLHKTTLSMNNFDEARVASVRILESIGASLFESRDIELLENLAPEEIFDTDYDEFAGLIALNDVEMENSRNQAHYIMIVDLDKRTVRCKKND